MLRNFCFQGERRIRVHTMKFPTVKSAIDVFNAVDTGAVVALLSKMGNYLNNCYIHAIEHRTFREILCVCSLRYLLIVTWLYTALVLI